MKRGVKPQNKIKIKWSPEFAYAIGLLAADGSLSKDKRHIDFTSKDLDLIMTFKKCLCINHKIGIKNQGAYNQIFRIQFGSVQLYAFLETIGLTKAKSKTIQRVDVPVEFFFDFFRGLYDGDGSSYSYWDKRWKSSFMFYISVASASPNFLIWLQKELLLKVEVKGHITTSANSSCLQLKYAKTEALEICKKMYYSKQIPFLKRKYLKIKKSYAL